MNNQHADQKRLALVHAGWHFEIVKNALHSCREQLKAAGYDEANRIDVVADPGSLEIPFTCQELALTGRYDAIIAFGLIVNGGIYRHEFVASAVIDGLMRVQLDTKVRIFSSVLTPIHFHEHDTHLKFFAEHMKEKGAEVANAYLQKLHPDLWERYTQSIQGTLASR